MPVTVDQNESSCTVSFEGVVNIAFAAELKATLTEALDARQTLRIHFDQATVLDVCIVQLLLAANREWKHIEMDLTLVGPMQDELSAAMMDAGFEELLMMISDIPLASQDVGLLSEV